MTDLVRRSAYFPFRPIKDDSLETRVKKACDTAARKIGRSAVNHLKDMYPDALASVTKTAEVSLTNHIRNEINDAMRPILTLIVQLAKQRDDESRRR